MKFKMLAVAAATLGMVACGGSDSKSTREKAEDMAPAVAANYVAGALAVYQDSLTEARELRTAVQALTAQNGATEQNLNNAKAAWLDARVPYQQSEVYRFGNAEVDDWEGQLNAWPLDEGLIDYVDAGYQGADGNGLASANVIGNADFVIELGAEDDVADELDEPFIRNLQELTTGRAQQNGAELSAAGDSNEANVATGYHAIEFLLWGQDLNGTGAGAGARTAADYAPANAESARRAQYLNSAADVLVEDLEDMVEMWEEGGSLQNAITLQAENAPFDFYQRFFLSLAKLSAGELAGERMNTALENHSVEDEHDCFSDNTHNSHFYNAKGLDNLLNGAYARFEDGVVVKGTSIYDVIALYNQELATEARADMGTALDEVDDIREMGEADKKFDQLIAEVNPAGTAEEQAAVRADNAIVQEAIDALTAAGDAFVRAAAAMGIDVDTEV